MLTDLSRMAQQLSYMNISYNNHLRELDKTFEQANSSE